MIKGRSQRHAIYPQERPRLLLTTVAMKLVDIFRLTNEELMRLAEELAVDVRTKTCDLIESLAEIDRRKLYQDCHYVSLFDYCTYRLRMSEAAAYRRIRAARAFQTYPPVGPLLRAGKLTLESLALLHPFLNDADAGKLVQEASGKRVWEVERLVAGRRTEEPRRDVVRFIAQPLAVPLAVAIRSESPLFEPTVADPPPETTSEITVASGIVPAPAGLPAQISRRAIRIAFTADEEFFKLLKEAQAAMRHKYPNGRLDGVFRDALVALLKKKRPWAS